MHAQRKPWASSRRRGDRAMAGLLCLSLTFASAARAVDPIIEGPPHEPGQRPVSRPRKRATIDPAVLADAPRARRAFDEARGARTTTTTLSSRAVTLTLYDDELYRCLIQHLGTVKHYRPEKAQKLLDESIKDMKGQVELYVRIDGETASEPSSSRSLADSCVLALQDGKEIHPCRTKTSASSDATAFTLWFDRAQTGDVQPASGSGGNCTLVVPARSSGPALKVRAPLRVSR